MFSLIMQIPYTRDKIMKQIDEMSSEFEKEASEKTKNMEYITKLMAEKGDKKSILRALHENLELGKIVLSCNSSNSNTQIIYF